MEPGPIPILIASAPRRIRSRVASAVPTLPAMTGVEGNVFLRVFSAARTPSLWPCEESRQRMSTLAAISSRARSTRSAPAPTAAPTRSRPSESLQAFGYLICFWMSLTVIRPFSAPALSTTRSFSIRCSCRSCLACSSVVPGEQVTRSLLRHPGGDRKVHPGLEPQVAVRQDSDELARGVDDRDPGDPEAGHHGERLRDLLVGKAGDRVDDHAALRPFHLVDLGRLVSDAEVLVDDAEPAVLRDRDREPRLGDGVHRRRDHRDVQRDVRGELGLQVGHRGVDLGARRNEQDVVEGEGEGDGRDGRRHTDS